MPCEKLPPGDRANRALFEHLLRPRFLGYWTFSEPIHRRVELSDAVVIWDDTVVLFEVKTWSVKKPADVGWLRKKIGEAVDQLNKKAALFKRPVVAWIQSEDGRDEQRLSVLPPTL